MIIAFIDKNIYLGPEKLKAGNSSEKTVYKHLMNTIKKWKQYL